MVRSAATEPPAVASWGTSSTLGGGNRRRSGGRSASLGMIASSAVVTSIPIPNGNSGFVLC
jgi:hypothetical protein